LVQALLAYDIVVNAIRLEKQQVRMHLASASLASSAIGCTAARRGACLHRTGGDASPIAAKPLSSRRPSHTACNNSLGVTPCADSTLKHTK
jgi:hypothetical protein